MKLTEFFTNLDLVIATIYLLSIFFTTQITKLLWKNKKKSELPISPVYISWIIGAIFILIAKAIDSSTITFIGIVQFAFLTLALNGGVKIWNLLKKLKKLKDKVLKD